jgi:hypothetical protein
MATLGPQIVSQSYGNLLKFLPTGEAGVTTSQVQITDGKGKVTPLHLATGSVYVSGTLSSSAEVVFNGLTPNAPGQYVSFDTTTGRLYYSTTSSIQNVVSASYAVSAAFAPDDGDWIIGSSYMTASGQDNVFIPGKLENGIGNYAQGNWSHAEGSQSISPGPFSHAEGRATTSSGYGSHAEGVETNSPGAAAHAEGKGTIAGVGLGDGDLAHAEGHYTKALSFASHAEGNNTYASASYAHAEGNATSASGVGAHAEGYQTLASGQGAHAEGSETLASFPYSHAEGRWTTASQWGAHAEGRGSIASAAYSHAEGLETLASNLASHAEGWQSKATGNASHAEGQYTTASGDYSHAEGEKTQAVGDHSHAEGTLSVAQGNRSHAEGKGTLAFGPVSHAEGHYTTASGLFAHSEGNKTLASGSGAHSGGTFTTASLDYQTVVGQYNVGIYPNGNDTFVVGTGTGPSNKADAFKVRASTHEVIVKQQPGNFVPINPLGLDYEYIPGNLNNGAGLYFGEPDSFGSTRVVSSNIQNSNVSGIAIQFYNGTFYQSTISSFAGTTFIPNPV